MRLLRDEAGSYLILFAMLTPVLIGIVGLGTEGGLWLYSQQAMQGAADSAAVAAARAYSINPSITSANLLTQAEAMTCGLWLRQRPKWRHGKGAPAADIRKLYNESGSNRS